MRNGPNGNLLEGCREYGDLALCSEVSNDEKQLSKSCELAVDLLGLFGGSIALWNRFGDRDLLFVVIWVIESFETARIELFEVFIVRNDLRRQGLCL